MYGISDVDAERDVGDNDADLNTHILKQITVLWINISVKMYLPRRKGCVIVGYVVLWSENVSASVEICLAPI